MIDKAAQARADRAAKAQAETQARYNQRAANLGIIPQDGDVCIANYTDLYVAHVYKDGRWVYQTMYTKWADCRAALRDHNATYGTDGKPYHWKGKPNASHD